MYGRGGMGMGRGMGMGMPMGGGMRPGMGMGMGMGGGGGRGLMIAAAAAQHQQQMMMQQQMMGGQMGGQMMPNQQMMMDPMMRNAQMPGGYSDPNCYGQQGYPNNAAAGAYPAGNTGYPAQQGYGAVPAAGGAQMSGGSHAVEVKCVGASGLHGQQGQQLFCEITSPCGTVKSNPSPCNGDSVQWGSSLQVRCNGPAEQIFFRVKNGSGQTVGENCFAYSDCAQGYDGQIPLCLNDQQSGAFLTLVVRAM